MDVSVPLRGKYCRECSVLLYMRLDTCLPVSVPLRGKYCRESIATTTAYTEAAQVSVPLRGKYCRELKQGQKS